MNKTTHILTEKGVVYLTNAGSTQHYERVVAVLGDTVHTRRLTPYGEVTIIRTLKKWEDAIRLDLMTRPRRWHYATQPVFVCPHCFLQLN